MTPSTDAAASSSRHPTSVRRSGSDSPPFDAEVARKARINNEMIEHFLGPAKGPASIQGVGLYTHTASSRAPNDRNPTTALEFLPLGGPNRMLSDVNEFGAPIGEDVRKVWEKLREAVRKEEEYVGQSDMSEQKLKERYGALGVLYGGTETTKNQQQLQQAMEQLRHFRETHMSSKDVTMGGTEEGSAGRGNDAASGTNMTIPRDHEYDEARDPRKRL